jgi:hypothetical protein
MVGAINANSNKSFAAFQALAEATLNATATPSGSVPSGSGTGTGSVPTGTGASGGSNSGSSSGAISTPVVSVGLTAVLAVLGVVSLAL